MPKATLAIDILPHLLSHPLISSQILTSAEYLLSSQQCILNKIALGTGELLSSLDGIHTVVMNLVERLRIATANGQWQHIQPCLWSSIQPLFTGNTRYSDQQFVVNWSAVARMFFAVHGIFPKGILLLWVLEMKVLDNVF